MATTIIEQLASNSDFIARFKDDPKKAIKALIDTKQIAADAHMVKRKPYAECSRKITHNHSM